jgi:hypothetical protein
MSMGWESKLLKLALGHEFTSHPNLVSASGGSSWLGLWGLDCN